MGRGRQSERVAAVGGEQGARQGQQLFAEAVRQQAVVADAHEAFWQHVQEEAAQELYRVEGHDTLLAAVRIVPPAEADVLSVESGEAVIADGHAVGVAAEIAEDMFGTAERRLGIDVPVLVAELLHELFEPRLIHEIGGRAAANEQVLAVELPQSVEELLTEHGAQYGNGQQEQRMSGRDPALMIGRQSSGGNDRVDMGSQNGSFALGPLLRN